MAITLVDTHVHFHFPDYDKDRQEAIKRARQAGVTCFINVGTDIATSRASLALAEREAGFYAAVGFHPHEASRFQDRDLAEWENLARQDRSVAIGEVGLDFFRDHSPRTAQEKLFHASCELAKKLNKPLILHVRDAFREVFAVLREHFPDGFKGVFHCFSGDVRIMEQAVALGFHISFAGPLTYKKNEALREAARATPEDRLLIETDAPFLPPQSQRGKRNEPALMLETAGMLAGVRNISLEELARFTTENATSLFGLRK